MERSGATGPQIGVQPAGCSMCGCAEGRALRRALPATSVVEVAEDPAVGEVVAESFGVADAAEVSVAGGAVVDLLAAAKFVGSKGEARRLVAQGGVRLNDAPVTDPQLAVTAADLRDGAAKLSLGRKRHLLVRAV